jgi:hypothetical protein
MKIKLILKHIYGIVVAIVLAIMIISFTDNINLPEQKIITRSCISLFCIIFGTAFIIFSKKIGLYFYGSQMSFIKRKYDEVRMINDTKYFGGYILAIGLIVGILSIAKT